MDLLAWRRILLHIQQLRPKQAHTLAALPQQLGNLLLGGDVGVHPHGLPVGGGGGRVAELFQLGLFRPVCGLVAFKRLDLLWRGFHGDLSALGIQQKPLPVLHLPQQSGNADDAGDIHGPGQNHTVGGQSALFQHDPLEALPAQLDHLGGGEVQGGGNFRAGPDGGGPPPGQDPEQPLLNVGDVRRPLVEIGVIQCGQLFAVCLGALGYGVLAVDLLFLDHAGDAANIAVVL